MMLSSLPDSGLLSNPRDDDVLDPVIDVIALLRRRQRVIAVLDDVQRHARLKTIEDGPQLVRFAKGIARALDEQHRRADLRKVRGAELVRFTRGMQRISEEDEAAQRFRALAGSHLGRNP